MKFIVIALSVGGLGNKIYNSGDIVTDGNFPKENIDALVRQGFLKPFDEVEKEDRKIPKKK